MSRPLPDTRFTEDGSQVRFFCPYHPQFPSQARNLGGTYQPTGGYWTFDARDRDRVAALSGRLFGTTGDDSEWDNLVTVTIPGSHHERAGRVVFAGRTVAKRRHRDWPVHLEPGVILFAGTLKPSGGSLQYPVVDADDDVFFQIRDLPRAALQVEHADAYTIVETRDHKDALLNERERLADRLTWIDQELARLDQP